MVATHEAGHSVASLTSSSRGAGLSFATIIPRMDGSLGFGGEESAGASFLRRDGAVWTTDLSRAHRLAAEIDSCHRDRCILLGRDSKAGHRLFGRFGPRRG